MAMPVQKPGRSKQNYRTPHRFLEALRRTTGRNFDWDLAADQENKVSFTGFFSEDDSAFDHDWANIAPGIDTLWCNPTYKDIDRWVEKASKTEWKPGQCLFMLIPASVGSKWFNDYVFNKACVRFLLGRLSFDGKGPYPKDCMLLVYGAGVAPSIGVWDWRRA